MAKEQWTFSLDEDTLEQVVNTCCQLLAASICPDVINIYDEAWGLVSRAREKAVELGIAVVISVVDAAAQVVMSYRMEHALLVSNDMAYKKAYTAVGMKMPSRDLGPLTQPGQWLYQLETMTDHKVVSLPGGMPIFDGDQVIGAIGISGGDAHQDQLIAEYALIEVNSKRASMKGMPIKRPTRK